MPPSVLKKQKLSLKTEDKGLPLEIVSLREFSCDGGK